MKDIDYSLYLNDFIEIYNKRQFDVNQGGMQFPHMFGAYCLMKMLNPKLIIESGVWKGYSTWLFEQTCPDAKFVCIEPMLNGIKYKTNNALYYTDKDFNTIDWNKIITDNNFDSSDVVVFFDDHQDFDKRLKFIKDNTNIKNICYEDNYPKNHGNCLSPKKILTDESVDKEVKDLFDNIVEDYFEFPPVYKTEQHRFGNWNDLFPEPKAIFNEPVDLIKDYISEMDSYTWLCYIELKG